MQILVLGYLGIILVGTFFLCLPISAKNGGWTAFIDSLLVATSATCVTGLITVDTFLHWTTFGQIVVLLLIQIGGLGFMTFVTLFSFALGRRIGLFERTLIAQSAGSFTKGGILSASCPSSAGEAYGSPSSTPSPRSATRASTSWA